MALSTLRDAPGRDGAMLGLPPFQHRLRVLSQLPAVRRRPDAASAGSIVQRRPLRGDEIRPCWEARPDVPEAPAAGIPRSASTPAAAVEDGTPVRRLEFVEVATGARVAPARVAAAAAAPGAPPPLAAALDEQPDAAPASTAVPAPETRWSLWGDLEG